MRKRRCPGLKTISKMDKRAINPILSVDVEEYYHAENILYSLPDEKINSLEERLHIGLRKIVDLLEQSGSKATFFVLGCIAEKNKSLLKEISNAGHEIASHGYYHKLLSSHTNFTFEEGLDRSIKVLSDITGKKVIGYRAPSFSFDGNLPWFFDILKKKGVLYDSSISCSFFRCNIKCAKNDSKYFEISEDILEFPTSFFKIGSVKIPLGGGYFRAYPYQITKWGLNKIAQNENPSPVFYVHPWELDFQQPRLEIPPIKRIRHYLNLDTTERKLKRLLSDMKFTSIGEVLKSY